MLRYLVFPLADVTNYTAPHVFEIALVYLPKLIVNFACEDTLMGQRGERGVKAAKAGEQIYKRHYRTAETYFSMRRLR
jgi:hypothetical protein